MNEWTAVMKDLVAILQEQAKVLEKLALKIEQQTSLRDPVHSELTLIRSELAALYVRVEGLAKTAGP